MIGDIGRMGSLDVMEMNPALDIRNGTTELAVDLIGSLFGKSTLMRRYGFGLACRTYSRDTARPISGQRWCK